MKQELRFWMKKLFNADYRKGKYSVYGVFAKGTEPYLKSLHEDLEDAKASLNFGDTIVKFVSTSKVELQFTETEF